MSFADWLDTNYKDAPDPREQAILCRDHLRKVAINLADWVLRDAAEECEQGPVFLPNHNGERTGYRLAEDASESQKSAFRCILHLQSTTEFDERFLEDLEFAGFVCHTYAAFMTGMSVTHLLEDEIAVGRRHAQRMQRAKGGRNTRKLNGEAEAAALELVRNERGPGVSQSAAITRAMPKLAEMGLKISATTIWRRLREAESK